MKSKSGAVNFGLEIRYTMRAFTRVFSRVASPLNVTHAEFRVLQPLGEGGTYTQSELADIAALDRPYVTSLVRKMIERGLLQTRTNTNDARRIDLSLSKTGKSVYRKITSEMQKIDLAAVKNVSRADLEVFLSVVQTIRSNLANYD